MSIFSLNLSHTKRYFTLEQCTCSLKVKAILLNVAASIFWQLVSGRPRPRVGLYVPAAPISLLKYQFSFEHLSETVANSVSTRMGDCFGRRRYHTIAVLSVVNIPQTSWPNQRPTRPTERMEEALLQQTKMSLNSFCS